MSCPPELGFHNHGFNAGALSTVKHFKVSHLVLPSDAKDGLEAAHVELLQLLNVFVVQGPSLTSIQKAGEDSCLVEFQVCGQMDIALV